MYNIQEKGSTPHSTIEVILLHQTGITTVSKFIG
jgi:hypothetical protein